MSRAAASLLSGVIDCHVHTAPDLVPRRLSDHAAAAEARAAGMRGLLIKSHVAETASRARLASELSGVAVYGALVLNQFVGGLNAHAVRAALSLGAKVVFMPTFHAANHLRHHGDLPLFAALTSTRPRGVAVLDDAGGLVPDMADVLAAVAEAEATLATGHVAPHEAAVLTRAALAAGVPRVILTHVLSPLVNMSLEDMVEISAPEGVFVEQSYLDLTGFLGAPVPPATAVTAIRAVGVAKTVLSSDGGQANNPLRPVEMLERFAATLFEHGLSRAEIRSVLCDNPARALGLDL